MSDTTFLDDAKSWLFGTTKDEENTFLPANGNVFLQSYDTKPTAEVGDTGVRGNGLYTLKSGLECPITGFRDIPIVIQDISIAKQDAISTVGCLGGHKIIYSFGTGFGELSMSGLIFLDSQVYVAEREIPQLEEGSYTSKRASEKSIGYQSGVDALTNWFNTHRPSTTRVVSPVEDVINPEVSNGSTATEFIPIRLTLGGVDPEYKTQSFEVVGVIIETTPTLDKYSAIDGQKDLAMIQTIRGQRLAKEALGGFKDTDNLGYFKTGLVEATKDIKSVSNTIRHSGVFP